MKASPARKQSAQRRTVLEVVSASRVEFNEDAPLSLLREARVAYERADDHYLVASEFLFWPFTGFWRRADRSRSGYTVGKLIAAIRDKDAAGRESVAGAGTESAPS